MVNRERECRQMVVDAHPTLNLHFIMPTASVGMAPGDATLPSINRDHWSRLFTVMEYAITPSSGPAP